MSKRSIIDQNKMSCTVMYQPYAMSSSSYCDRPPEKKPFRFPYVPSPPDSLHSEGSSYSHSSPGPIISSISSSSSLGNGISAASNGARRSGSSYPSAPATITSASGLRSPHRSSHTHSSSSTASSSSAPATITSHTQPRIGDEQEDVDGRNGGDNGGGGTGANRVQYLSANCIVYENYREETARVVEDHFNRALSASGSTSKCSPPMSTRNFPPSFWNSNYQLSSISGGGSKPFVNMGSYGATAEFYGAAVDYAGTALSGHLHQSDPWHYPLTTAHHHHHQPYVTHSHRATELSSYPAMPSTSRFNAAQYGSFFLGAAAATTSSRFSAGSAVVNQCGANLKGDASSWSSGLYHHSHDSLSELNLADYAAHYTNRTAGLETTVGQDASTKDPYWF